MASPHSAMFDGHRYCGSRDIMVLVCHMKESGNVMVNSPLRQVTILSSLMVIRTLTVEI